MQNNGLAGIAIGVAVVVLTLMIVVIMSYVFKDKLLGSSGINLTTEAEEQVNSIWGYGTLAFTIIGLGVLIMSFTVAIRILRGMGA